MLSVLIKYVSGGTYSLTQTSNDRLFETLFQILLFLFAQTLANFLWSLKHEIDIFSNKPLRPIKNSENFCTKSSFKQNIYMKNIT